MRKCGKDEADPIERHVVVGGKREMLASDPHALTTLLVRGGEREREPRMLDDERAQFATSVAAGAEYSDRDLIHNLMHNHALRIGQSRLSASWCSW